MEGWHWGACFPQKGALWPDSCIGDPVLIRLRGTLFWGIAFPLLWHWLFCCYWDFRSRVIKKKTKGLYLGVSPPPPPPGIGESNLSILDWRKFWWRLIFPLCCWSFWQAACCCLLGILQTTYYLKKKKGAKKVTGRVSAPTSPPEEADLNLALREWGGM